MKKYPSKIDLWLIALLAVLTALLAWGAWHSGHVLAFVVMILWLAILALMIFPCYYVLTDSHLLVRSGMRQRKIPYTDIKSVRRSRSFLAGPALSLQRVEIQVGPFDSILVSPLNRDKFIEDVQWRVFGLS
ncbi:PH domain-containing protein [Bordetella genomosp. 4]|uniref:Uncharacterized protein YyaB-like PH domain-containing protein n=1 Tax=Bordetella genomosp. 4 TaxID=463044 RepID=A0A261U3W7_9BORD|nr:PH domain-containing protein [Bordetella genomosp. 4]OZI56654.1 hypothetical protein CAL20_14705 [Bordetella genomosp. 4]